MASMKFGKLLSILLTGLFFQTSCGTQGLLTESEYRPGKPVRNIIFVVGDGMGLSQITAGMYASGNSTVFEQFPVVGLMKTHSADELITDSSAGATAFSCGEKTNNGAVAVDPQNEPLQTIFEEGTIRGYSTGIAVTSTITHATPACFYAHDESRQHYEAIAEDLALSDVDVAIGYGMEQFNARADGRDLVKVMEERGISVNSSLENVRVKRDRRQMVLLPGVDPPGFDGRPVNLLQRSVSLALDQLSANKEPFIMLVEGSQIDWAGHANNEAYLVGEMKDFDGTLREILNWASKDGQTLVVVTADHETGGYAITEGLLNNFAISGSFSTLNHTATMVPVFAYGRGATLFSGIYDNTAIFFKLRQALGWE